MSHINNSDLARDIDKIKDYDEPTISMGYDYHADPDRPFRLEINDSGYQYATATERNNDFRQVRQLIPKITWL